MTGRPKIDDPRSAQLNLSFTAAEIQSIKLRAEALGMRPTNFGRALLLRSENAAVKPDKKDEVYRRIYHQLCRIGNNLNQMMRHLHQNPGEPVPADLEPLLADIREIIARLRK